ncbi:interleukin-12 receptor subunit beta-2 [Pseudophryne corroboree]|uniref:interleukin-12 receptor subunit beta-2 n=1 Tax=Pseudophryne corroboree TaxID=495146 RepID=UPI003081B787
MVTGLWMSRTAVIIIFLCLIMKLSAEECTNARLEVSPGTVIHLGTAVNLTCTIHRNKGCSSRSAKISNEKNTSQEWRNENADSVSVRNLSLPLGKTEFRCWNCKLVCGTDICVGLPPDQPRFDTCEQEGEFGRLSCRWERGRKTAIDTNCTLQLRQTEHNRTISRNCSTSGPPTLTLPVSVVRGAQYTAQMQTSNELGTSLSLPYTFTYFDVVKPFPPTNMTLNCHQTSNNCTVTVRTAQDVEHFQLRYRATGETVWKKVEFQNNRTITLRSLHAATQYQLEAACKYLTDRGKWSDWSQPVMAVTPEDAPRGKIELWYKLHNIRDKSQTITLFWKYLNVSEVRGHIQVYRVIFQRGNELGAAHSDTTTTTQLTRDIDTTDYVISVSAHNSRGSSQPTYTTVTAQDISGLLGPTNAIATSRGPGNSLTLTWDLQTGNESLAGDQIVEWEEPTGTDHSQTNWIKVPKHNRSVTISGLLQPYVCYQFRVYLLRAGKAGVPSVTTGATQQKAPLTAPVFNYKVQRDKSILVTWKEISPDQQMGCITRYSIYLRHLSSQATQEFQIFSNRSTFHQYEIRKIEENVQYIIWMTCANDAGESPSSTLVGRFILPQEGTQSEFVIIIPFILILFLCCVPSIKQRMGIFLSGILPQWCDKTVPDPANCEWAKEYISTKDKMGILPTHPSGCSNYDETETLEIEEMVSEDAEAELPLSPVIINGGKIDISDIRPAGSRINLQNDLEALTPILTLQPEEHSRYKPIEPPQPLITGTPSDYLVNDNIKVDYLPTNMLNMTMVDEEEDEETFLHQFSVPSWITTGRTIRLDTVQINFPYAV